MTEPHSLTNDILQRLSLTRKGTFNKNYELLNWQVSAQITWNHRFIWIGIVSKNTNLKEHFVPCSLKKSDFLTILSYSLSFRSDSFSFYGKKSKFADLILQSRATIELMEAKNAKISLNKDSIDFYGGIRKKDISSLSNVLTLNEMILKEFNQIIDQNVTQQRI